MPCGYSLCLLELALSTTSASCHHSTVCLDVCVQCTSPAGVDVDVSIGDDRGIRAARWLLRCQERWPALRPLVLLLKGVLRVLELHDVSQGVASPVLIRPRMQQTLIRFYVGSFILS